LIRGFRSRTLRAQASEGTCSSSSKGTFSQKPLGEWLDIFDEGEGVPCAPINTFEDILHDPVVVESGLIHELELPNQTQTWTVGYPVKLTDYTFPDLS